jgi:hypothetical protein
MPRQKAYSRRHDNQLGHVIKALTPFKKTLKGVVAALPLSFLDDADLAAPFEVGRLDLLDIRNPST